MKRGYHDKQTAASATSPPSQTLANGDHPMAKACTPSNTNPAESIGINVAEADRRALILACCQQLFNLGFKNEIGHWRERAAGLDLPDLIGKAQELGVTLRRGNETIARKQGGQR
jgi:hypothetical protein